jgi:hypothetical protein
MTARFRIVHFVPDPFSGMRVPVAALVLVPGGVRVVRAPHTAGPGCVGGLATWHNMQGLVHGLEAVKEFDRLPMSLGPHVLLDAQREIPSLVEDPEAWVAKVILPQRPIDPDDARESPPSSPRRESVGHTFFRTWNVDRYVTRHFKGETLGLEYEYAGTISHAVMGSKEVMLMEPVLGQRPDLSKQLEEISKTFLAWEKLLERKGAKHMPRLVAYMFSTPHTTVREARQFLNIAQAEVVDVQIPNERDRFVSDIRRIGLTNPANSHLS